MLQLFAGCYCSTPKVSPKNWKTVQASCNRNWYVQYRFYDPTVIDDDGKIKPRQVLLKGMNKYLNAEERRNATKALLLQELDLLQRKGYNPITNKFMNEDEIINYEIHPNTPFITALQAGKEKLSVGHRTHVGIKSVLKGIAKAAGQLRLSEVPISQIRRRHLKAILERCGENAKKWSPGRYNLYRSYMMMIYKELVELETVDFNIMKDISKKTVEQRIKQVLTEKERKRVDDHLARTFPRFHKFIHLFFHSGGRKTELLQLKPGNVDLVNQKFRCMIKKRKKHTEVDRTIKTVAVPYWEEFLRDCPADQFLFGPGFIPAAHAMSTDMPTKYWRIHVKEKLGISADLYSLKHLNTSEVVDALDDRAAAALNGHTSTAMVIGIYDVKRKDREHEKLKGVNNSFA